MSKHWVDEGGTSWWEVSKEGADPVSLQGPGPCRGLRSVPREELEATFTLAPLLTGVRLQENENGIFSGIVEHYKPSKKLGLKK